MKLFYYLRRIVLLSIILLLIIFPLVSMQQDAQTQKDKQDIILITEQEEISDDNAIVIPYDLVQQSELLKEIVADCNNIAEPIPWYQSNKKTLEFLLPYWQLSAENKIVQLEHDLQQLSPQIVAKIHSIADYLGIQILTKSCKKILVKQLSSAGELAQFSADKKKYLKNLNFNDRLIESIIARMLLQSRKPELYKLLDESGNNIAFTYDDTLLASSYKEWIDLWDAWRNVPCISLSTSRLNIIKKLTTQPQHATLASIDSFWETTSTIIRLWDYRHNNISYASFDITKNSAKDLAYHPYDDVLISCSEKIIKLWDCRKTNVPYATTSSDRLCNCIALSHDGKWLAVGCNAEKIYLYDYKKISDKPEIIARKSSCYTITCLDFNVEDTVLAVGTNVGQLILWDYKNKKKIIKTSDQECCHYVAIASAKFSPRDLMLAVAPSDGTALLYDYHNKSKIDEWYTRYINKSLAFDSSGSILALGSSDHIILWNMGLTPTLKEINLERSMSILAYENVKNKI